MAGQPTVQVVQVAAAYYAATRRDDEAEQALASLDKLQISQAERHAARARHYHAAGKHDRAAEQYRAAVAAAPGDAELARGLVASLLRTGRVADAMRVAQQVAGLQRLVENAPVVDAAAKDRQVLPLVVAIVEEPEFAQAAIDALRVVAESRDGKAAPATVAGRLRPIADRAPRLLPLQRLLLNYHLAAGQSDAAVAVATRCMKAAPDSPELAQLAAEVFGAAGSWPQALAAAEQWRNLSLSDTLAADQFIAQAHVRLSDPAAALKQLEPHRAAAEAAPEAHAPVLLLRARAMLMQGELAKAGDSLWPHATRAAGWRMAWLELTSALNEQAAVESWMERLSPAIPEPSIAERLAMANTWYVASDRLKSPALFRRARAALEQLATRPDATADVFFGLAVIHEVEKRLPEAEENYRTTLRLNPQHAIAKNNLAMVITNRGGDLVEAMRLAGEAVRAQPNVASLYDTLATIQHKSRDYTNAAANLRAAIGLEPDKLAWRLNLADVLIESGDPASAGRILRETEGIVAGMKDVPAEEVQRLQSLRGRLSSARGSNQAAVTEP
jgi:tetratricopeptide (TPR) repeat protein